MWRKCASIDFYSITPLTLILFLRKKYKIGSRNFRRGRLLIWAVLPLLSPYLVRCERERVCHRASAHSSYIKNQKYKKKSQNKKKIQTKNLLLLPSTSVKQDQRTDLRSLLLRQHRSRPEEILIILSSIPRTRRRQIGTKRVLIRPQDCSLRVFIVLKRFR